MLQLREAVQTMWKEEHIGSIVDGLSAFLVLCYFQCAVITSQILAPSQLYGIGRTWNTTVSLFDGELDYLKGDHMWYAVPALL